MWSRGGLHAYHVDSGSHRRAIIHHALDPIPVAVIHVAGRRCGCGAVVGDGSQPVLGIKGMRPLFGRSLPAFDDVPVGVNQERTVRRLFAQEMW